MICDVYYVCYIEWLISMLCRSVLSLRDKTKDVSHVATNVKYGCCFISSQSSVKVMVASKIK